MLRGGEACQGSVVHLAHTTPEIDFPSDGGARHGLRCHVVDLVGIGERQLALRGTGLGDSIDAGRQQGTRGTGGSACLLDGRRRLGKVDVVGQRLVDQLVEHRVAIRSSGLRRIGRLAGMTQIA